MTRMDKAKPFCIAKRDVWEAYKQVKANRGAAGVDGQSIEDFDGDLSKNLYRIWNRMCSGSYFPPPVLRVDIPKGDSGGTRPLGIPTVSDRIAQMVVKRYLEPILEPRFDKDSYGYRPGKSAHEAQGARKHAGWGLGEPRKGDPAGGGRQPSAGESLSSLCVRLLDATGAFGYSFRTLRRRRYLPLSKRSTGAGITSGAGTEVCGMPATTAPAKDQSRLLQRCKSSWAISRTVFRFSRLYLSAEIGEKP